VITDSKLRFFIIIIVLAIALSSCNKNNDVIPDVTVEFSLNINDPEFAALTAIGNHVIVTSQTNNLGLTAAGFDYNGIIVFASDLDVFNAYDRTCPHDYAVNGLSIKVNVDFTLAVCPQCSTYYALSAGGTPYSGPGKYPLKNYRTSFDGRYIRVWN
jgi:nitrite reductase/ring-hydroxylating ferredoxin subunit